MTPRYQHDCTACIFQGRHGDYDLYYCPRDGIGGGTVLARASNVPSDYQSSMVTHCLTGDCAVDKGSATYALRCLARRLMTDEVVSVQINRDKVNDLRDLWLPLGQPKPTKHCSVCGATQFETDHGVTCSNGHGGAPAKEDSV